VNCQKHKIRFEGEKRLSASGAGEKTNAPPTTSSFELKSHNCALFIYLFLIIIINFLSSLQNLLLH